MELLHAPEIVEEQTLLQLHYQISKKEKLVENTTTFEEIKEAWEEECLVLEAIYADQFIVSKLPHSNTIVAELHLPDLHMVVELRRIASIAYPFALPWIELYSTKKVPSELLLRAKMELMEYCTKLLGMPMLYEIGTWIEINWMRISTEKKVEVVKTIEKKPAAQKSTTNKKKQFPKKPRRLFTLSKEQITSLNEDLFQKRKMKLKGNKKFANMSNIRAVLPAYKRKEELLEMMASNQVLLISGETGCGKTTQVFILFFLIIL